MARNVRMRVRRRYNECEDFYARIAAHDLPRHDVLVTNPPYSGDNVERLLQHCKGAGVPFALLMPNWVYVKDYFRRLFPRGIWYLVPKKRCVLSAVGAVRAACLPRSVRARATCASVTSLRVCTCGCLRVRRYVYLPPSGAREKKASGTQKKTSPFVSMWCV